MCVPCTATPTDYSYRMPEGVNNVFTPAPGASGIQYFALSKPVFLTHETGLGDLSRLPIDKMKITIPPNPTLARIISSSGVLLANHLSTELDSPVWGAPKTCSSVGIFPASIFPNSISNPKGGCICATRRRRRGSQLFSGKEKKRYDGA